LVQELKYLKHLKLDKIKNKNHKLKQQHFSLEHPFSLVDDVHVQTLWSVATV